MFPLSRPSSAAATSNQKRWRAGKEIAQQLGPSPFTVRNQVKIIIRKLELKNRVQVAYLIGQQVNIQVNIDEIAVLTSYDVLGIPWPGPSTLPAQTPGTFHQ